MVGLRSCISEGAIIEDTLLMGADYYEVKHGLNYLSEVLFNSKDLTLLLKCIDVAQFIHCLRDKLQSLNNPNCNTDFLISRQKLIKGFWLLKAVFQLVSAKTRISKEQLLTRMQESEKTSR